MNTSQSQGQVCAQDFVIVFFYSIPHFASLSQNLYANVLHLQFMQMIFFYRLQGRLVLAKILAPERMERKRKGVPVRQRASFVLKAVNVV